MPDKAFFTTDIAKIFIACFFLFMMTVLSGCKAQLPTKPGFNCLSKNEALQLAGDIDIGKQGLDSWKQLRGVLERNLEYICSKPKKGPALDHYGLKVTWAELAQTLKKMLSLLPRLDEDQQLLARNFKWYELQPRPLFTGYYEPVIDASLESSPNYPFPLYGVPEDLKMTDLGQFHPRWKGQNLIYRISNGTIEPYYDRQSIEASNALREKAPIVAWAKDPMDIFFLQIQGSGRLLLPDGKTRGIGYAAKNGRRYVSLGRVLQEKGYLSENDLSMQSIRQCIDRHPELLPEVLYNNPSYVFFRLVNGGPYGAMGKKLTPMVSLASDPKILPLGSITAFILDLPGQASRDKMLVCGLGSPQDVGGAIQGHHLDLFCGTGNEAGALAGRLKQEGRIYLLLAK